MRIATFHPRLSYYVGGGELIPLVQIRALATLGHSMTVLTVAHPGGTVTEHFRAVESHPNVAIRYLQVPEVLRGMYEVGVIGGWRRWDVESVHMGRQAAVEMSGIDADLYVAHNVLDSVALPYGKPAVVHLHGYPDVVPYGCEIALYPRTRYITASRVVTDRWLPSLPEGAAVEICENGIDLDAFAPIGAPKEVDLLYLGRLQEIKGVQYLLEAVRALKGRGTALSVAIAGTGGYESELKKMSRDLRIADLVEFIGYVPEDKKRELYDSARVAVFPSFGREGIMTTVLEAAACGVPVITTEGSSMAEFVVHGVTGFLVPPADAEALAHQIEGLLADGSVRLRVGAAARASMERDWTVAKKIHQMEAIYVRWAS